MRPSANAAQPGTAILLTTVALGSVLAPLNSTMLAVALPEIRGAFALSHAEIGWLISAYLIAMAVAQPIGGRLGDQLGRALVFRSGLIAFLGFSLAAALAPNFALLVTFRTGQAIVGAAVIPTGMAMLRESVAPRKLAQTNGVTGSVLSLSAALGPVLGALLLGLGSWRLLFLVNVPLVALALIAQARLRYPAARQRTPLALDWIGAALLTALLVFLTLLLNSVRGGGGLSLGVGATGLGVTALCFVYGQRRTKVPVAAWSLFRIRTYRAATTHIMLSNLVMYTTLLSIPFFIREVQDKGVGTTGLLLGAMSILMALVAPLSGRMADTYGRRLPILAGSLIAFASTLLILVVLDADVSVGVLAVALMLVGAGVGIGFGVAATAAIESAPREMAGAAAGTNSMMRYGGSILGAGLLAGILNTDGGAIDAGVFHAIFAIVAVVAGLAILAATQVHRFPPELEFRGPGVREVPQPSSKAGSEPS